MKIYIIIMSQLGEGELRACPSLRISASCES